MRTRSRLVFLIVLAAASAAFALLAGACGSQRTASPRRVTEAAALPPAVRTLSPLPARALSPESGRALARAMRKAEAARELGWLNEPAMIELTGWEYGTRARELTEVLGGGELRAMSRLAVAGGMLPEGTDLATLAASFTAAASSAVYSPYDKRVLLLATERGAREEGKERGRAEEPLLAHELTHALQDQHFDLLALLTARPYSFDRTEAAFAVVEGDAVSVQRRVEQPDAYTRLSPDEEARREDARFGAFRTEAGALFPPLLTETVVFRYRDGLRLVETVRRRGGARAVDELFRRPPASSEQVLHPEKYAAGETAREALLDEGAFTQSGWTIAASTPLGEIGVRGLLLKSLGRREAESAAAGWGGDRAYLFERAGGGGPLFAWRTVWDTTADAQEFFRSYNEHARARGKADEARSNGDAQRVWRDGDVVTIVRLEGETVLVLRGREQDVSAALQHIR